MQRRGKNLRRQIPEAVAKPIQIQEGDPVTLKVGASRLTAGSISKRIAWDDLLQDVSTREDGDTLCLAEMKETLESLIPLCCGPESLFLQRLSSYFGRRAALSGNIRNVQTRLAGGLTFLIRARVGLSATAPRNT